MVHDLDHHRGLTSLLLILFLAIVVVVDASLLVLGVERRQPGASIQGCGDALWWAVVTVTTMGNGDEYPLSELGRIAAMTGRIVLNCPLRSVSRSLYLEPRRQHPGSERPRQGPARGIGGSTHCTADRSGVGASKDV